MPSTHTNKRQFVTLDDAAEYLNVSPRTIRRLIASGELPGFRVAGHRRAIRLDVADLDAIMQPIPSAAAGQ